MNSSNFTKQILFCNKRFFATSLYNYTARTNPRVYLTLSKNGKTLGDLVFELYHNHCPKTAENFISLLSENNALHHSYKGTSFTGGYPGILIKGG